MTRRNGSLTRLFSSQTFAASLSGLAVVVAITGGYASCGKSRKKQEPVRRELPEAPPPPVVDPTSGEPVALDPAPLGLDGTWAFAGFQCEKGALTPWAKVENSLVSEQGLKTPSFQWPTEKSLGLFDQGTVKRSHIWTISGSQASKVTKLEYHSSRQSAETEQAATASEPTAWASTSKNYEVNRTVEGQLVFVHGRIEKPVFSGLPLQPITEVIAAKVRQAGSGTSPIAETIQKIQDFLRSQLDSKWVDSTLSFFNEVTQATETVDYALDNESLTLSNAAIAVKGLSLPGGGDPRGVRLIDVTICGVGGKASRQYTRIQTK